MEKKRELLYLGASPQIATGFATVSRHILKALYDTGKYNVTVVGINFLGDYYDQKEFPYKIYPARMDGGDDIYGRQRFLDFLSADKWDIAFTLYDPFILAPLGESIEEFKQMTRNRFKWVGYYAVDAEQEKSWVLDCVSKTDFPVMYSQYGMDMVTKHDPNLEDKAKFIYHGVNLEDYFYVGKQTTLEFKRRFLKNMVDDDTFIITNVNRNQTRKDIGRTLLAFKEFKKLVPNSLLYLHMRESDLGGSITQKARQLGLENGKDITFPRGFNEYNGVPHSVLNMIYNMSDIVTSTSVGEGFGLSSVEAMATKTLTVMPNHTTLSEILGDDRGLLVEAGNNLNNWAFLGAEDMDRLRPLVDVADLVSKWKFAYDNPEKKKEMEENAFTWIKENMTWDIIGKSWVELLDQAYDELEIERKRVKRGKK